MSILAESASELIEKHTKQAAESIEAYLQKNPNATDANEATDFLIESYARLKMTERQAELLGGKYKKLAKGADLNPQEFFGMFQKMFDLHIATEAKLPRLKKDKSRAAFLTAKKDIQGHPQAAEFQEYLEQICSVLNRPEVGEVMEMKFTSLAGKEIDLADMKGKVVLVDFWATWCGPCIAELPNVLKAYEAYHDKGFEIIGISLDNANAEAKLKSFVKAQNMPWPQFFDGKGWGNALAKKNGITSIPATFLVGKDGKIVSSNLVGRALNSAVKKELGL